MSVGPVAGERGVVVFFFLSEPKFRWTMVPLLPIFCLDLCGLCCRVVVNFLTAKLLGILMFSNSSGVSSILTFAFRS